MSNFPVIVAKKVDEQLQSKQALGLRGGYCFETAAPHRVIQVVGKKIRAAIHPRKKRVVPVQMFRSKTPRNPVPFFDKTVIPIDLVYPVESVPSGCRSRTERLLDFTPSGRHNGKREIQQKRRRRGKRKTKNGGFTPGNLRPRR
jgi:hypothetical protein